MSKPIIAIDIDDVLVDSAAATINAYNTAWGSTATLADYYIKPDPAVWLTDSMETVVERVHMYQSSPEFFRLEPTADAVAGIKKLTADYELHAVTGRWDVLLKPTERWLDQHFPGAFASLVNSNFFHADKARSKGDICLEIGASYLLDDHLKHCVSAVEAGLKAVLFGQYPWNKVDGKLPKGVTRCNDWSAVLAYFEKVGAHV